MKFFDLINKELDGLFGDIFTEEHPKITELKTKYKEETAALDKKFREEFETLKQEIKNEGRPNQVQKVAMQAKEGVAKVRSTSVKVINGVREEMEVVYDKDEDPNNIVVSIVKEGESSDLHIPIEKAMEYQDTKKLK